MKSYTALKFFDKQYDTTSRPTLESREKVVFRRSTEMRTTRMLERTRLRRIVRIANRLHGIRSMSYDSMLLESFNSLLDMLGLEYHSKRCLSTSSSATSARR
jgi:hypothetical protein